MTQACALIAQKRGEDTELAMMAGMLHDIYSYAKMDITDHAHKGAILAKEILASLRITDVIIVLGHIGTDLASGRDKRYTHIPGEQCQRYPKVRVFFNSRISVHGFSFNESVRPLFILDHETSK
jgi:hypothetical protein